MAIDPGTYSYLDIGIEEGIAQTGRLKAEVDSTTQSKEPPARTSSAANAASKKKDGGV